MLTSEKQCQTNQCSSKCCHWLVRYLIVPHHQSAETRPHALFWGPITDMCQTNILQHHQQNSVKPHADAIMTELLSFMSLTRSLQTNIISSSVLQMKIRSTASPTRFLLSWATPLWYHIHDKRHVFLQNFLNKVTISSLISDNYRNCHHSGCN